MRKLLFILMSLAALELVGQDNSFSFPEDSLIKTVTLDYDQVRLMKKIKVDTTYTEGFSIDAFLAPGYTYEETAENTTETDSATEESVKAAAGSLTEDFFSDNKTTDNTNMHNSLNTNSTTQNTSGTTKTSKNSSSDNTITANNTTKSNKTTKTSKTGKTDTSTPTNTSTAPPVYSTQEVPDPSGQIIFKVQFAASPKPLPDDVLKNMYPGNREIIMSKEGGWYKYSICQETSYTRAKEIQKEAALKHSFIVAYHNNQKLNLMYAIKGKIIPFNDLFLYTPLEELNKKPQL